MTLHESLNNTEEVLNENKLDESAIGAISNVVNNISNNGFVKGIGKSIQDGLNWAADKEKQNAQKKQDAQNQKNAQNQAQTQEKESQNLIQNIQKAIGGVKDEKTFAKASLLILQNWAALTKQSQNTNQNNVQNGGK